VELTYAAPRWRLREPSVLPGFRLALGFTLLYLGLILLIPLAALIARPWEHGVAGFWQTVSDGRVLAALKLSFGVSLLAAAANVVLGLVVTWVLVRYDFPGKRLMDAAVDLPFALPTAVAGIALTTIYAPNGWVGALLAPLHVKIAYTPLGIWIALVFVGLPFIVRSVQPVLQEFDSEVEEAAVTLGAGPIQKAVKVILPGLLPAIITAFSMAFARAVGEYGSVIFIAGNIPMISEITPLIIITKLEQYDYAGATTVAAVMLIVSFILLLIINALQAWTARSNERAR
jgi:sulfate transport system permease protein